MFIFASLHVKKYLSFFILQMLSSGMMLFAQRCLKWILIIMQWHGYFQLSSVHIQWFMSYINGYQSLLILIAFNFLSLNSYRSLMAFIFLSQVVVTFGVGAAVSNEITNDYAYMGQPFLMGTVALGKLGILTLEHMPFKF